MKNKLYFVIFIIILLSACVSSANVSKIFDESLPIEKTSRLSTRHIGNVVGYNGIKVDWETNGYDMIQIPAGDTLLEWNLNVRTANVRFVGNGIKFRYNFQPQKQYLFLVSVKNKEWGFNIWGYDYNEKIPSLITDSAKNNFIEFIPFLNFDNRLILN